MLKFGDIKKTYNGQVVLDVTDFSIEENKIYTITGPNGCGKSTLSKIIAGLINDDSEVKKVCIKDSKEITIGYLPQKPYVFNMSLEKNILINGKNKNKCEELIDKFGIGYLKGKNAKGFSGGEQQKLSLARLMMKDYDLVILDEPTAAMDEKSQTNAENVILEYSKNKTLIMITHNLSQIEKIADIKIFMKNGKIEDGITQS